MKIGIVGLGLIGGSIFKDLIKLNYDVVGISQRFSSLKESSEDSVRESDKDMKS